MLLKGQNEFKRAEAKKGNLKELAKGPNGEPMLSATQKLQKRGEIEAIVKRGNAFSDVLKRSGSGGQIKELQHKYDQLYMSIATKLDYIAKDLGATTNIAQIGGTQYDQRSTR